MATPSVIRAWRDTAKHNVKWDDVKIIKKERDRKERKKWEK